MVPVSVRPFRSSRRNCGLTTPVEGGVTPKSPAPLNASGVINPRTFHEWAAAGAASLSGRRLRSEPKGPAGAIQGCVVPDHVESAERPRVNEQAVGEDLPSW